MLGRRCYKNMLCLLGFDQCQLLFNVEPSNTALANAGHGQESLIYYWYGSDSRHAVSMYQTCTQRAHETANYIISLCEFPLLIVYHYIIT